MDKPILSKTAIFLALFLSSTIAIFIFLDNFLDPRTKVVFCDVGQGDASYIRIKNKFDLLIDAGPDRKILNCLGKYMPFFDRKIELAILTHPQKDHYGGFLYLLPRYQVEKFVTVDMDSRASTFQELKKLLQKNNISILYPLSGTKINILSDQIEFLWPVRSFSATQILGASTLNPNDFSLVFQFKEKNQKILFTADATTQVLNSLIRQYKDRSSGQLKTSILKLPHHGSKTGLNKDFIKLADPTLTVISVGKNNPYGHPTSEVLALLQALKKKYIRTDEKGDVVIRLN